MLDVVADLLGRELLVLHHAAILARDPIALHPKEEVLAAANVFPELLHKLTQEDHLSILTLTRIEVVVDPAKHLLRQLPRGRFEYRQQELPAVAAIIFGALVIEDLKKLVGTEAIRLAKLIDEPCGLPEVIKAGLEVGVRAKLELDLVTEGLLSLCIEELVICLDQRQDVRPRPHVHATKEAVPVLPHLSLRLCIEALGIWSRSRIQRSLQHTSQEPTTPILLLKMKLLGATEGLKAEDEVRRHIEVAAHHEVSSSLLRLEDQILTFLLGNQGPFLIGPHAGDHFVGALRESLQSLGVARCNALARHLTLGSSEEFTNDTPPFLLMQELELIIERERLRPSRLQLAWATGRGVSWRGSSCR
mmetsp:Transcript_75524/g.161800  ORF Transcript_75524/g.161800 Transcript_75524/m.161800 type:complete len:361 (+) Transcript_75524:1302-2384(+)